jgi:hypothetical protein
VDPTKFPKGTTIKIRYIGGDKSEDLKKDKSGGCSASSSLLSYGTVEVTAYDKYGKEIKVGRHVLLPFLSLLLFLLFLPTKNLDGEGIGVGFNIPGNSIDDNIICVGSTDSSKSNWECDPDSTQTDKKGKVGKVKRRFNPLTSVGGFICVPAGCLRRFFQVLLLLLLFL